MNKDALASEQLTLLRMNRRDLLRVAVALPVLGTLVAAALIARGDGAASAKNQPGAATPLPGTPTSCATPILGSPVATPAAQIIVTMTNELRFDPEELTISVGDTVTWLNASNMPHTATCDPGQNPVAKSHPDYVELPDGTLPWGSALLQPNESFTYTFTTPGEYRYFCIPHVLSGMRGRIHVEC